MNTSKAKIKKDNNNMNEVKLSNKNYYDKSQLNKKEEELFYKSCRNNNRKWTCQDKTMNEKFKKGSSKAGKILRISKKQTDYFEMLFEQYQLFMIIKIMI